MTAEPEKPSARALRAAFYGVGSWGFVTLMLLLTGVVHERTIGPWPMVIPFFSFIGLGVACNVLDVPMLPAALSKQIKGGLRDKLWRSRLGAWLARRFGAPERSITAGNAFRATEAALGLAVADLFAALPAAFREQLSDLPAMVSLLEARAAEARAEMDMLAEMAPSPADAELLETRRKKAAAQLSESVAALEGIRLELLRVHSNAGDLAPLTTLLDAARAIGEDIGRLAEGQREAEDATRQKTPV